MKAYTVTIGNFSTPLTEEQKKVLEITQEFKGLIAFVPHYPDGTLLLFETLNDAKEARNIFRYENVLTGTNIVEIEFDKKTYTISNGKTVA